MADTIINTPGTRDDSGASAVGWVLALIVALAVIAVAVFWYRNGAPSVPNTGTNINVELPDAGAVTPDGAMQ